MVTGDAVKIVKVQQVLEQMRSNETVILLIMYRKHEKVSCLEYWTRVKLIHSRIQS